MKWHFCFFLEVFLLKGSSVHVFVQGSTVQTAWGSCRFCGQNVVLSFLEAYRCRSLVSKLGSVLVFEHRGLCLLLPGHSLLKKKWSNKIVKREVFHEHL